MPVYVHPGVYYPLVWSAQLNQVDPNLLAAVVWQESGFNPHAVGDAGKSYGLGQLHLEGAGAGHKPADLLDPGYNLAIAAAYLRNCLDLTPSVEAGVSAYNQGVWGYQVNGMGVNARYVSTVMALCERIAASGLAVMHPANAWYSESEE